MSFAVICPGCQMIGFNLYTALPRIEKDLFKSLYAYLMIWQAHRPYLEKIILVVIQYCRTSPQAPRTPKRYPAPHLESQIANCTDDKQLASLQSQLASAVSSRSADELAAKQTCEEAVMYYENAQSLYDVSLNDVGSASEEAADEVDAAQADLEAFEEYIADGSIRAEYSGTVTGVGYAAGDTLTSDTAIASFADEQIYGYNNHFSQDTVRLKCRVPAITVL